MTEGLFRAGGGVPLSGAPSGISQRCPGMPCFGFIAARASCRGIAWVPVPAALGAEVMGWLATGTAGILVGCTREGFSPISQDDSINVVNNTAIQDCFCGDILFFFFNIRKDNSFIVNFAPRREVAQAGSAPGLGPGGRRYESCLPDVRASRNRCPFWFWISFKQGRVAIIILFDRSRLQSGFCVTFVEDLQSEMPVINWQQVWGEIRTEPFHVTITAIYQAFDALSTCPIKISFFRVWIGGCKE